MIKEKVLIGSLMMITAILPAACKASMALMAADNPPSPKEILGRMSLEEKVGQLIWLQMNGEVSDLTLQLRKYNPAGISIVQAKPSTARKLSMLARNFQGKSRVLVDGNIQSIMGIVHFPDHATIEDLVSDPSLLRAYYEASIRQMRILGFDRSKRYGRDLDLELEPLTGHKTTLKKSIFESDGIIISGDPAYWFDEIFRMIQSGEIPRPFFESKVLKVLEAKAKVEERDSSWMLDIPEHLVTHQLGNGEYKALNEQLYLRGFRLLKDDKSSIPVINLNDKKILHISTQSEDAGVFETYLKRYYPVESCFYSSLNDINIQSLQYNEYDYVIVEAGGVIDTESMEKLLYLDAASHLIVVYMGPATEVHKLLGLTSLLWHPESKAITWLLAPQILFGGLTLDPDHHLPVRLSYTSPELAGMDSRILDKIDKIVSELIAKHAAPGCQILVARNGHVVYDRSFGSLFYDHNVPVTEKTLYDLASITKVLATLPAIMYLEQVELLDIDDRVSDYLYELRGTDKENIVIRDVLMHQAGLFPYLPFWRQTVNQEGLDPNLYSEERENEDWAMVSPGIYSNESLQDSLWKWTIESRMRALPDDTEAYDYKYSDLGFYIMKELVERVSGMTLDEYTSKYLYKPMGLSRLTFLPLEKYSPEEIAPTELDKHFRHGLVHGTVHDQTAAMFGGVAGHAGLFANANDIAKLMQMFLWNGQYGGQKFFESGVIEDFTSRQNQINRRGLGWDKPDPEEEGNTSYLASFSSFGHTGFTGTSVWADPDYGLIYVFLSNRVHPDVGNNKLGEGNFRIRIQDLIYQSVHAYEKSHRF